MGNGCSNSNESGDRVVNSTISMPRVAPVHRNYPSNQYDHQNYNPSYGSQQNMQQPMQMHSGAPVNQQWVNPVSMANPSSSDMGALLNLGHPMNVNRRYNDCFEYYRDHFSGDGVKFTHSYCSKIPEYKLEEKRKEFWDTRVEGSKETWEALKIACEADEETTLTIIQTMEIQMVNNTIQMTFDRMGHKYDIPIFCINDPIKYKVPQKKKIAKEELTGQLIHLKFRKAGVPTDVEFQVPNNITGFELKQEYVRHLKESLNPAKVRLFFGGKEMVDKTLIAEYGVQNELVVQVFVKKD